jgi:hypothetical protein
MALKYDLIIDDPTVPQHSKNLLMQGKNGVRARQEERIRKRLTDHGYSLMRRRGDQYWFASKRPMTLDEIEVMLNAWGQE